MGKVTLLRSLLCAKNKLIFSIKFYQPHTFIGILTLVIYTIQWMLGALFYFLQIVPLRHKISFMPIHRAIGSLSYVLGRKKLLVNFNVNF